MNADKSTISSPKKVVEGIQEVFDGISHMLEGVIEQLEELEETEPAEGIFCENEPDVSVPPAETAGKKPVVKRQRKTPEKKAKAVKEPEKPKPEESGEAQAAESESAAETSGAAKSADEMADTAESESSADADSSAGSASDTLPWEPPKNTGQQDTRSKPADSPKAVSGTITKDDITAVIVAKIKQKRDNNEKIGKLLSAYGVKALSDLPDTKYEAFLADISQI